MRKYIVKDAIGALILITAAASLAAPSPMPTYMRPSVLVRVDTTGNGTGCTNAGYTGTGPCVRKNDATLVSPTANWLNQTGKSTAGNQILCVGDSNCEGIPDTTITWLNMMNLFTPFASRINLGIGGQTAGHLDSAGAYVDSLFNPLVQNVLINNIGTNNAPQGTSAVQTYAQIASYNLARRNKGWLVVTQTIPDRCGYNDWRDSLNTLIRANWPKFANALADLGASPLIGLAGTCVDPVYFDGGGGLHFTPAGKRVDADITQNAINAFYKQSSVIAPVIYGSGKAKMAAASTTINGDSTRWNSSLIGSYVQFSNGALFKIFSVTDSVTMTATRTNSDDAPTYFSPYTIVKPVQYLSTNPSAADFGASAQGTFTTDGFMALEGRFGAVDSSAISIINSSTTGTGNNECISWKGRSGFNERTKLVNVCGGSETSTSGDEKGSYKVQISASNTRGKIDRLKISSTGVTEIRGNTLLVGDAEGDGSFPGSVFSRYSYLRLKTNLSNWGPIDMFTIQDSAADSINGIHHTNFKVWDAATIVGGDLNVMTMHHNGNVTVGRNGADMGVGLGVRDSIASEKGARAPIFNTTGNAASGAGIMTTTSSPCASGNVTYIPHQYKGTSGYILWCAP